MHQKPLKPASNDANTEVTLHDEHARAEALPRSSMLSSFGKLRSLLGLAAILSDNPESTGLQAAEPFQPQTPPLEERVVKSSGSPIFVDNGSRIEFNRKVALSYIIQELCALSLYNTDGTRRSATQTEGLYSNLDRAPLPLRLTDKQERQLVGLGEKGQTFQIPSVFSHITNGAANRTWLLDVYGSTLVKYAVQILQTDPRVEKSGFAQLSFNQSRQIPQYGCSLPDQREIGEADRLLSKVAGQQAEVFRRYIQAEISKAISTDGGSTTQSIANGLDVDSLPQALWAVDIKLDTARKSGIRRLFSGHEMVEGIFIRSFEGVNQQLKQGPLNPGIFARE